MTAPTPAPLTLTLEQAELAGVLQILDGLPTSSNAWPLVQKIKQQVQAQLSPPIEAVKEEA